ncbi:2-oxoglutarate-dependent dioxygenase [Sphingomonas sp. ID1715]|uniref:2OG-Fe(II) oxygenase n=1 Tax=Sphingomonas sp. ID1715 TaxID=1656898 RepID=UPI001488B4C8|nr:2OG-Fe(II) oxygenase [Sphingomonas sp. ID1715]NNM76421.1 2-oxoglutarate-dependent dioxygenase [Sphingomonas sp. ID1715]
MQFAEPSWQEWIARNLSAGCDPADMQVRMIAAGWNEADARAALSTGIAQVFPDLTAPVVALPVVPDTGMIRCEDREIRVTFRLQNPAIALCENVLSEEERAELLKYAQERGLQPSTVVDEVSGDNLPHPERTSSGVMLDRSETGLISRLERRLAALTDWPVVNGEGLQILRYRKDEEYRPHFDSFPDGAGGAVHIAHGGQRVNTVLIYLQSPASGGATAFPSCGVALCPRPGSAVIFRNVDLAGRRDPASLHAGLPVVEGEKVIMTYWQRAGAFA